MLAWGEKRAWRVMGHCGSDLAPIDLTLVRPIERKAGRSSMAPMRSSRDDEVEI